MNHQLYRIINTRLGYSRGYLYAVLTGGLYLGIEVLSWSRIIFGNRKLQNETKTNSRTEALPCMLFCLKLEQYSQLD